MKKRLLLISNSLVYGGGYLDHCASEIADFLGKIKTVLFVPYALKNRDKYAEIASERFKKIGVDLYSIHRERNPIKAVLNAESLFIGGGNTFRALNELYKNKLLNPIRYRVKNDMPFIGSSAGANIACPTIKTTNDMPIIEPPSFKALNLVPFQINPHYIDTDPKSKHMGETRETRIKEFLEENNSTVIGLREGSWIKIERKKIELKGTGGAKIFLSEKKPVELKNGNITKYFMSW